MQIHRNEITTGILVLITLGILSSVLVIIGMPGVIKPIKTFYISFDNAAGIRPGDPVLLAGRQIGEVTALQSPVPITNRPEGHKNYEVLIEVKVDKHASVQNRVKARLYQQGLMGQQVIDFVQGDEKSDLAPDKTNFVGERVPELSELAATNIQRLTGEGSDLARILKNVQQFTDLIKKEPWRLIWKTKKESPEEETQKKHEDD